MKIVFLMITFVCIILIGVAVNNYYKKRKLFFGDLCAFCDSLKVSISYSQDKVNEIIAGFKKNCEKDFLVFLELVEKSSSTQLSKETLQNAKELRFLSQKERQDLANFFCQLGNLGVEEEVEKVELGKNLFLKTKERCDEEQKKLSPLYIKLFVVLALGVLVIFL